jgi:hypothetical protein
VGKFKMDQEANMRLNKFLLVIFSILLTCSLVYAADSSRDSSEGVGRYQLFQGTYTSINLKTGERLTHTGIFLIDTKTGQVKRYLNKIDEKENYIETWLPTEIKPEKK